MWIGLQNRYFFSAEFVDHWIVHVGGFLIDLLSGFGLCFRSTRPFTIVVLLIFHGMNSIMFSIGMIITLRRIYYRSCHFTII